MDLDAVIYELEKIFDKKNINYNEPMKNHTSFRVGGPADIFIIPEKTWQVISAIKLFKEHNIPFFIMGNGTNIVVRDGGFKGAVIKLTSLNNISVEGNKIKAQSGAFLSNVSMEALKNSLKGMEFASGIPGTVGGAVTMNAGAYGPEIKDVIESAVLCDYDGNLFCFNRDELELSYRHSIVQSGNYIVLEAVFALEKGDSTAIRSRMEELNRRRADKQPLNYPSAGSTFKRPEGYFAGKLIEDAGLKGYSIGGAKVSEKHAGFIINYNNATAKDIIELIKKVQEIVNEKFGVLLEPEIKIIGEE
ncbi:UDP-N-acetylmuramate dehydrogenase [Caloramator quimbayensis]|uniref:UDP-N-acetylenolpyruvoylglucosamine reductase n=1 Tax=Caloramator quimbayensis TaxID=1147123 RepID=A0A1T4Y9N6_9CLOT|nr:UDP-N-acetylmuramate dehydrogenase [Caloramator quimbayensis]SKA98466.1 UDP-N-acetylmuramate dehydrogenase [Caloramator quimbayensis]